jgi:predicted glutamine amidotransferase
MCELLGINFNEPVNCSLSFRGFRKQGESNPDGWGIALHNGETFIIHKEPLNVSTSQYALSIQKDPSFESTIFLAHIRKASRGEIKHCNTHPFSQFFKEKEIVFAHNGTICEPLKEKQSIRFIQEGDTDSERFFCDLLDEMADRNIQFSDYDQIQDLLIYQNHSENNKMNLLFSDGMHLFCYRDLHGHNNLFVMERSSPFEPIQFRDTDWVVDLEQEKRPSQRGYVIASCRLTSETWSPLTCGCLYVFQNGRCIFGSIHSR